LAGLTLGVMITNGFARFAYGLILPAMKSELGWTYAQAGWLNTANALGYVVGAVLTLLLIGRVAPSRLFSFGLVATTLSLLATGYEATMGWQTFWRIAAGVFGAMSFSTASVLTARLFPGDAKRNALAIAILFGTGGGLGIMLAGASLPLMLETWLVHHWHSQRDCSTAWLVVGPRVACACIAQHCGGWAGAAPYLARIGRLCGICHGLHRVSDVSGGLDDGSTGLGWFDRRGLDHPGRGPYPIALCLARCLCAA
jgi:MFS family permease